MGKKVVIKVGEKTVDLTTSMGIDAVKAIIRQSIEDIQRGKFSGEKAYLKRISQSLIWGRLEDLVKTKLILRKIKFNELKLEQFYVPIPKSRALVPVSKGKTAIVLYKDGAISTNIPLNKKK